MRFTFLWALSGVLAFALAQDKPNPFTLDSDFSLTAGKPTDITWTPTTGGTVTLRLRQGASSNLNNGGRGTLIQANVPNDGKYTYTPSEDVVRGSDYSLEIISDSDPEKTNYSAYFVINSDNTVASVTSLSGTPTISTTTGASTATPSTMSSMTSSQASAMSSSASRTTASSTTSAMSTMSTSGSMANTATSAAAAGATTAPASAPTGAANVLEGSKAQGRLVVVLAAAVAIW